MLRTERALREAYARALEALDVARITREAVEAEGWIPRRSPKWAVLAAGKCAATMAAGAVSALGAQVTRVLVARPTRSVELDAATREALSARRIALDEYATGHPLPDEASVRAGEAALAMAGSLAPNEALLVLLSGGASAAICAPREGVSLEQIGEATRALVDAGLPIDVINTVRGRLDRVKHGGLLRATPRGAQMETLIVVDVLGGPGAIGSVGSGPTMIGSHDVPDEAIDALPASLRAIVQAPSAAQLRPDAGTFVGPDGEIAVTSAVRDGWNRAILTPADARSALSRELERAGYGVIAMPDAAQSVERLASIEYRRAARELAPHEARVAVGEPTVKLPANRGQGGRAGLLALRVAKQIRGLEGVAFLAGATDGVDGEGGLAGAVVTGESWDRAVSMGLEPDRAIARCDDARVHRALGTALERGPTGINLLDLHAFARDAG